MSTATAGELATAPHKISRDGWIAIGKRVVRQIKEDHLTLLAGGISFYTFLSLFPAVAALVTIWALFADPAEVQEQLESFLSALPEEATRVVTDAISRALDGVQQNAGAVGFGAAASLLASLWSASSGMAGMVEGINAAYDEVDERPFPKKRGLALLLIFGAIVFLAIAIGLIVVVPVVLDLVGLGRLGQILITIARWPALFLLFMGALAVLYRVGPDRAQPRMRWVSWGAVVATVLWLLVSGGFSLYVGSFGGADSYAATYGAIAGVVILLFWLFLTAFSILLGAEVNAEIERQTLVDSTTGPSRPMGDRGAFVADNPPGQRAGRSGGRRARVDTGDGVGVAPGAGGMGFVDRDPSVPDSRVRQRDE